MQTLEKTELDKTYENVRKIRGYGGKCVKILIEMGKRTYTQEAIRLVANRKWENQDITNACIILLERTAQNTITIQKKAKKANALFDKQNIHLL